MRNPVAPIPSPSDSSDHSRRYWAHKALLPPTPGARCAPAGGDDDPTRALRGRGDVLGLDRRESSRRAPHGSSQPGSTGLAAAAHQPLRGIFGLKTRFGWAVVGGLSRSPEGALVELVDVLDPDLDPAVAREAKAWLPSLSSALAQGPSPKRSAPSMLGTVGSCVLARRLVADLATWADRRGAGARPLGVTLLIPDPAATGRRCGRFVQIPGTLAPLTDPSPSVLGVHLTEAAGHRLRLATQPRSGRAIPRPQRGL